ncbi:hypothetical protein PFICI_02567 [Pestalotiopsis fici W106-1]|uniref:Uncharacterized protein n=1 Tax=Pestalotiopsis fici (strain W106-1 / CGMCC3.15140) TaxID=1229662 RepID=W3XGH9_PESFW|nr:uncharacterized protein PFICI_02567 [Pestalotiopsis fici W106-1]ETS84542.1 hypothetical protein PFICI_02567 [Pestalotiopsis fici W106-1]
MFITYLKNSLVSGFERIKETLSLAEDKALESLPEPYIPTAEEIAKMPEKLREKATRALHGSDANPSMLDDPISLKAEQSDYVPGPDEEGAGQSASSPSPDSSVRSSHRETLREKAAKKVHGPNANPSQLGDPISMKAENNDLIPKPEEEGARRNRDSKL